MTTATTPVSHGSQQNLFGICARVGEDFGFNPLWLRLAFAGVLILNPVAVIASYFALGAVVLTSRLLFPKRARDVVANPAVPAHVSGDKSALTAVAAGVPDQIREHAAEEVRLPLAA